ncbi:NADP-specific glutamate dehydrogenase [Carboxylicivirga caseinilyticus]|uniref:NADP-specific glutamate dehydrogenase n=1 Tax=Carboxylicivirga caseinilyticus TaxID=3417572 RepID=UPI003D3319D0|nr:NADP-specific glutamate dehydrogenase [Marinilabiliaceae bacterium A049]
MGLERFLFDLEIQNPGEPEFIQSVRDFLTSVKDRISDDFRLNNAAILERITEPDRVFVFKVPWMNDQGKVIVNRGYRVQYNNALGPYKGGLRFHPALTLGTVKMLAFEQVFKNSLTSLALGGAMGGANFDPKGKSEGEIMRFCQSFVLQLWDLLGSEMDIPGNDVGVSSREIGYMFGMFKKLTHMHSGTFTGKGSEWGGTGLRAESTGFGVIYFLEALLKDQNESLDGKTICVSGFGNVAYGVIRKAVELGAKVVTLSGPDGFIYDPDGITGDKLDYLVELRATSQDLVRPYSIEFPGVVYYENQKPWQIPCDIAIPCAIQNEIGLNEARQIMQGGCKYVIEAADRPCNSEALEFFDSNQIVLAPGKAANAGGVAVSALELVQNSMKMTWTPKEVDHRLKDIMERIYQMCKLHGIKPDGSINYRDGANIASFHRVTEAMIDQGAV